MTFKKCDTYVVINMLTALFLGIAGAFCSWLSASAQTLDPTPEPGVNSSIVREASGRFLYRKMSTGAVTGDESFTLTVHPDGTRTLMARNQSTTFDMQRHVIHRVAADFRPLETTAVYYLLGEWRGTGWFSVIGNKLHAVVRSPDGIITQERHVPDYFSFVPHPLATNAWHGWYYDKAKGGKQTTLFYDMDAAAQSVGSMLGKMTNQELEFIGVEQITVPAGTFTVDHFKVQSVDYYVTGPDAIMVKFAWQEADVEYLLTELALSPGYALGDAK